MQLSLFNQDQKQVRCWYCDKENEKIGDQWVLTNKGFCTAENSTVNGKNKFYQEVHKNTIQKDCSQYENKHINKDYLFKTSLILLRELADLQNGPPLERYRKEWEECIANVYNFLKNHE